MDTFIAEWLAQSPQRDNGEDVSSVDQWLNAGLIDLGTDLGDEDLARSLEDLTGQKFFHGSPTPYVGCDGEHGLPQQQASTSSQPTRCDDGTTKSGGACFGDICRTGAQGQLGRTGAFLRSFSTNDLHDLQMLMEQQHHASLPAVAGLSAPAQPHGSHMLAMGGGNMKARPALESVPEGAPSTVVCLGGVLEGSSGGIAAQGAAVAGVTAQRPDGLLVTEELGGDGGAAAIGAVGRGDGVSIAGGLRHVPSTGTLSNLVDTMLSFQREGSTEAGLQQQQQEQQASSPPLPLQVQPPVQQDLKQGSESVAETLAAALPLPVMAAPLSSVTVLGSGGTTSAPADYGSGASAAAATATPALAAQIGLFPVATIPGLHQSFSLPPPGGAFYGIPQPTLYPPTTSFPSPGVYSLGLPMALAPAPVLVAPAVETDSAAAGAATVVVLATTPSSAVAPLSGSNGAGSGDDDAAAATAGGGAAPRLRKSQSALELGAWRSACLDLPSDIAEAPAGLTVQKLVGRLTPEERLQRILRYRSKRNQRNFNREIKYQCRKTLADSRPRVGGRFARNDDPNSVLPHQTKKALRSQHQHHRGAAIATTMAVDAGTDGNWTAASAAAVKAAGRLPAGARQQPGAVRPSNSTTTATTITTSSSSSDNQANVCASSGDASAAALASATSGGGAAAGNLPTTGTATLPTASMFAAAAGMPFKLRLPLPAMPFATHGLVPSCLQPQQAAAAAPAPAGPAAPPPVFDAAQLQQHYAVVNAAAQTAAQGVYAHLGMAAHGTLPLPIPVLQAHPLTAPMKAEVHSAAGAASVFGGRGAIWAHKGVETAAAGATSMAVDG